MEEDHAVVSSGPLTTPDEVSARTFTTTRKGYRPDEVRQFLSRVADELAGAAAREAELRSALRDALDRSTRPQIDEETLTAALGEHAARLIASGREAAAAIVADAEKRAATLLHDAEVRAGRLREESEGLMARRVEEAEAAGSSIRQAAEAEVRETRDRARMEAEATVAEAQATGKKMVAEARAVRERMLGDLNRRRRTAQVQIDQLQAGRQRLLEAYDVVRRTLEEATRELDAAEAEARVAAEDAGRRSLMESEIPIRPEPPTGPPVPETASPQPEPEPSQRAPAAGSPSPAPSPPSRQSAPSPPPAPPVSVPPPAPAPERAPAPSAPALAVAGPGSLQRRPIESGRGVATLAPPRPPALRPQSVAEAAPLRARTTLAVVAPAPEPESSPVPVAEPAIAEPAQAGVESPTRNVDDLFARIRQEVPPPGAGAEARVEAAPEQAPAASDSPAPPVDVTDEHALSRRDEVLDPVESDLVRALKRILQDEQNEVLDRLRRNRSSSSEAVLPDGQAQVARYGAAATPFLDRAAAAGARGAGGDDDRSAAGGMAEALARELVQPLRSRLEQALAQGIGDDGSLFETISSIYRQWKVQQIEPLARHAAATAFTRGRFRATPDGTALRWLVDDEGGRCPDCDDNALAGPVAKGEAFPTGQTHPPAHPGCRCLLVATVP